LKRFYAVVVLDVSSRHGTPAFFDDRNDVVNFADVLEEDLDVENLVFEEENRNNKIKNEKKIIKN